MPHVQGFQDEQTHHCEHEVGAILGHLSHEVLPGLISDDLTVPLQRVAQLGHQVDQSHEFVSTEPASEHYLEHCRQTCELELTVESAFFTWYAVQNTGDVQEMWSNLSNKLSLGHFVVIEECVLFEWLFTVLDRVGQEVSHKG